MACVVVAGRNPLYELTAADLVVRQLEEISLVNLKQLFQLEDRVDPRVRTPCIFVSAFVAGVPWDDSCYRFCCQYIVRLLCDDVQCYTNVRRIAYLCTTFFGCGSSDCYLVLSLLVPGIDCILICFICTDTEECELLGLQLHSLCLLFNYNSKIAVVLLQAGTELEVEEEPEPAPYAKTLTLDRPW